MKCDVVTSDKWDVLTPDGWKPFKGVKRVRKKSKRVVTFADGNVLETTHKHLLKRNDDQFVEVDKLVVGDRIRSEDDDDTSIRSNVDTECDQLFYDLLDVADGNEYYTNGIVSHNCAFIRNFDTLWTGLKPTISTGGSVLLMSTPNGVGGMYYQTWIEAEAGINGFNPIKLMWTVHPEHDEEWFKNETRAMSQKQVAQEYLCSFIASGDTFLSADDIARVRSEIREPIERRGYDRNVWVWKKPEQGHRYVISADVCRGDSADFSTFHVVDPETCEAVAEYMGKAPPEKLAEMLNEWGRMYNDALVAPENNSFGYFTCVRLRELEYPRLYYMDKSDRSSPLEQFDVKPRDVECRLPGFSTQSDTRKKILAKLEEMIRNKVFVTHSQRLVDQLQAFVWVNNKPQAHADSHDDLVISAAIASWMVGHTGLKGVADDGSMAYAILNATSRERREASTIFQDIDNVQPPIGVMNVGNAARRDPMRRGRNADLLDYSWLLR